MSQQVVVRRFEVHAAEGDLDKIYAALTAAAEPFNRAQLKADITRHRRSPMVSARLTGSAAAASKVRESISADPGLRVLNDWLDVPAATRHDAAAGPDLVYPDPRVLQRIDPAAGSDLVYPDPRVLQRIDPLECARGEIGSGERVIVAIIDSGITVDHPDLADRLWAYPDDPKVHGVRLMDGQRDSDVTDQDGHGTMLAGTILATANHVEGIELMPVKFFDVTTQPAAANAAAAIRFAISQQPPPAIINLSFDLGIGSNELREAFRSACNESDALIVIAAGNTGSDNDQYPLVPACYADECRDKVIVVMATDLYDGRPIFSNFGKTTVDLGAPGVGIVSTRAPVSRGNESHEYGRYTGTSAAAAHVSGAAALLKSQNPNRRAREIKQLLMDSVDRSPWLKCVSGGRLNLSRAACHAKALLTG
jgi:subtilisin family serine protease